MNKFAFGFFSERADYIKRQNAWADEMNLPHNIDKINEETEKSGKKLFKKGMKDLHGPEFEAAYNHALTHPHFKAIHRKHYGNG